jgi:hypothetical protein
VGRKTFPEKYCIYPKGRQVFSNFSVLKMKGHLGFECKIYIDVFNILHFNGLFLRISMLMFASYHGLANERERYVLRSVDCHSLPEVKS